MKKIGLLVMALVLSMGMLGVGYAMWSETLIITGTVTTGEVDVDFSQYSNDSGTHEGYAGGNVTAGSLDPKEPGTWDPETLTWSENRELKNIASTNCNLGTENTLTITVDNGYPCYFGSVLFDIDNIGSIPVKVLSVKLISVSENLTDITLTTPLTLVPCTWYYVDVDNPDGANMVIRTDSDAPPTGSSVGSGEDFAFHLSEYAFPYDLNQIDPGQVGYGDITVHVEQDAEMLTIYDFTIEVEVCNWNEPGT